MRVPASAFVRVRVGSCVRVRMCIRTSVNDETVGNRIHLVVIHFKVKITSKHTKVVIPKKKIYGVF